MASDGRSNGINGSIPKAAVNEENGEISCSVEETNRIRALLGLKPLKVAGSGSGGNDNGASSSLDKEAEAVKNFKEQREIERKLKESEELRQRIEKSRNKRLLNEKLGGPTLATIGIEENDSALLSAEDWVKRSRQKAQEVQPAANVIKNKYSEEDDAEEYSSEHLKGLKVLHAFQDLKEGQDIILTLTDTQILQKDDRGRIIGVNEDEGVLENIYMTEEEKRQQKEKMKKRARQPVYAGYDDDEFDESGNPKSKRSILSHYDREKVSGPKFVIGESVTTKDDESLQTSKGREESLATSSAMQDSSDFFTKTEYEATFKKRGTDKAKKTRKRVKKEDGNEEEEDSGVNLDSLLSLSKGSDETVAKDRGSRKNIKRDNQAELESIRRKETYDLALKKAEEKTKQAFQRPDNPEKLDLLLQESLNRVQRLAETKAATNSYDRGAEAAMKLLDKFREKEATKMDDGVIESKNSDTISSKLLLDEIDQDGRRKDGKLIFSGTTEFTARLQALLNENARSQAEKAMQDEDRREKSRTNHAIVGEDEHENQMRKEAVDAMNVEDAHPNNDSDDDSESLDDEQLSFLHNQPLASRSTAAALALLKQTGELKPKIEQAGRANDKRDEIIPLTSTAPETKEVKIEYRDEYGRNLTKKEAFRQLCYRFHGYGPAKKNKEKRFRKMELERKSGTVLNVGTSLTMKSLEKAQEATGKAHITIQGGIGNAASNSASLTALAKQLIEKAKKKKETQLKKKKKDSA